MRAVTKLDLSNRSQAVRIPAHLRLPDSVKEVEVRACGQEWIRRCSVICCIPPSAST